MTKILKKSSFKSRLQHGLLLSSLATVALGFTVSSGVTQADVPSLNAHLAQKRAQLAAKQNNPAAPEKIEARVTAESRSGVRRLKIGDFQYLSDSDRSYAGYDLAPGSWDTFVSVAASAVANEFAIQAAAANIPVDAIDVVFTSRPDSPAEAKKRPVAYPRNLSYVAYIASSASDAQLETLRQTVDRVSPVLSLIRENQPVAHGTIHLTPSSAQRDPSLPPGLRDFLVEKRQAVLRKQVEAAAAQKEGKQTSGGLRAHAHIEPQTGIRTTRTGARNFQIIHDGDAAHFGYGLAPSAEQHQIGVLGTCLTHIFEIQAASKQVVLDSLEIRPSATLSPRIGAGTANPPRFSNISYSIHIASPATEAQIDDLRQAVENSCPIYNLLKDAQPIDSRVVRGRYAEEPRS